MLLTHALAADTAKFLTAPAAAKTVMQLPTNRSFEMTILPECSLILTADSTAFFCF